MPFGKTFMLLKGQKFNQKSGQTESENATPPRIRFEVILINFLTDLIALPGK